MTAGGTARRADAGSDLPAQAVVVIGDEASCAGFRLAGVAVHCPARDELADRFEQALARARLVVLTRECADALDPARLQAAIARIDPLVVVVAGIAASDRDDGVARRVRAMLGIES